MGMQTNRKITIGKQFTEVVYSTKEDIENYYNQQNVDSVFADILAYRSYYDEECELCDVNKNHFKINLNKSLISTSHNLENRLLSLFQIRNTFDLAFMYPFKIEAIKSDCIFQKIKCPDPLIEKLANNKLENIPSNLFILKAYNDAYDYAYREDDFTLESIENIDKILSGLSIDSDVIYRQNDSDDLNNLTVHIEDIDYHFHCLFSFLNQKEVPSVIKAILIVFFFSYVRPFEYFNEECASLAAKLYLKCNNFKDIAFSLPFEQVAFSTSLSYNKNLSIAIDSLDLTYYVNKPLSFFDNYYSTLRQRFDSSYGQIPSDDNPFATQSDSKFALPLFRKMEDAQIIEDREKKLLEMYPRLSKKQAHFYASHCQIGLHYTIEDFQQFEHSVYETARTSMDALANLGFYKKEKINKKFVYTPIPINS